MFTFADSDITEVDTKPPGLPADGHITIYWNDSIASNGGNNAYYDGAEIVSAYWLSKRSAGKPVWLQEQVENMIGGGETLDHTYSDSCLFDDPTSATALSADDLKLAEAVYSDCARPMGNKDLGTADNHDVDPAGTIYNE